MWAGSLSIGRSLTCIVDPQSGLLPKLVLCAGFSYLFQTGRLGSGISTR